jgi:hypothetical protein
MGYGLLIALAAPGSSAHGMFGATHKAIQLFGQDVYRVLRLAIV